MNLNTILARYTRDKRKPACGISVYKELVSTDIWWLILDPKFRIIFYITYFVYGKVT